MEDNKGKKVEKDSDSDAYEAARERVQNIVKHQFWRDDQIAKLDKGESVHFWCPCTDAALVGGKMVDWNLLVPDDSDGNDGDEGSNNNVAHTRGDDDDESKTRKRPRRTYSKPNRYEPGQSDTRANLKDDKTS